MDEGHGHIGVAQFSINPKGEMLRCTAHADSLLHYRSLAAQIASRPVHLNDLFSGIPAIFPIVNPSLQPFFIRNLRLRNDVGLFSTGGGYCDLQLEYLEDGPDSQFMCVMFPALPTSAPAVDPPSSVDSAGKPDSADAHSPSMNGVLSLMSGSVLQIDQSGIVQRILTDGRLGLVNFLGIEEKKSIFDVIPASMIEEFNLMRDDVLASKQSKEFGFRLLNRNVDISVTGKLVYIDASTLLLYVKDTTRTDRLERERFGFARFSLENPNPVFRLNVGGKILFANDASQEFTTLLGRKGNRVTNKDIKALTKACLADGITRNFVVRLTKDYYSLTVTPNKDSGYVNIYAVETTALERAREKLRRQSADLEAILNSTDDIILLVNKKLELIYFNLGAIALFGEAGIEKLSSFRSILKYIPEQFHEEVRAASSACFSEFTVQHREWKWKMGEQNERIFAVTFNPALDESSGYVKGLCMQFRDITEVTNSTNEIIRVRNFYGNILDNLPTDIAVIDRESRYQFVNPQAVADPKMREWMIGKTDFDYAALKGIDTAFAERRKKLFEKVIETRSPFSFVDEHKKKDGTKVHILRKYCPVFNGDKFVMMLGYGLDVTAVIASEISARHSQDKLREANEELQRRNVQLMQYSYIVSHNLRAPVANILGLSKVFDATCTDKAKNSAIMNHVLQSANRMDTVIRDLNHILAIRQDLSTFKEPIYFEAIWEEVVTDLRVEINNVQPHMFVNFENAKSVFAVRAYMVSILYNLLSNSLKYRDQTRVCAISVQTCLDENDVVLEFSDNGLGIDLAKHEQQVFGLYKRFHPEVATGIGVGLHIMREQIMVMGGEISVKSQPGQGTQFTIVLKHGKYEKDTLGG